MPSPLFLRWLRNHFILMVLLFLSGCRHPLEEDSAPEATVSVSQYQRAFQIIQEIDYLPFGYKIDGCYARALFESMELATERIPSSITRVFASDAHLLRLKDGTEWQFHVAPMLVPEGTENPMILDPSMRSTPIPQSEWLKEMGAQNAIVFSLPGSNYGYRYSDKPLPNDVIRTFGALPPFELADIQHACKTIYQYIGEEPGRSSLQISLKRARFLSRLYVLIPRLQSLKKISGTMDPDRLGCEITVADH